MLYRKNRRSFFKFFVILFCLSFIILVFQPRVGLISLFKAKMFEREIKYLIKKEKVENILLKRKIYLLKNDSYYLEKIIRENLNMIKDDEKILKVK